MIKRFVIYPLAALAAACVLLLSGCTSDAAQAGNKGMDFFNAKNYSEAAECFREAADKKTDSTEYRVYLGMALMELEDFDGALEAFDSAILIDPQCRDAYRGKGIVYYRQGAYEDALRELDQAISKSKLNNRFDDIHIDALRYYASALMLTDDYAGAEHSYTVLLENVTGSEKADLYYNRGTAYVFLREENKAVLDYEESLKIRSDDYNTYCNMYANFMQAGYVDRAESYLKRLLSGNDDDKLLFGRTYYNLRDYDKAAEYLETAYAMGEDEAAYYLAMTYEKLQNYTKADELYQEYLGKHPSDAHIYNQYGAYLIGRGSYDSALAYIDTGIEYNNEQVMQPLLFNRAVCYEYKREYAKALEYFREYLKKYPNDKTAQREYDFLLTR